MPQRTIVVKLRPKEGADLRRNLAGGRFEFRSVPHADFSAKGEGVVATLYSSGKLVVQGAEPEMFLARYGAGEADAYAPPPSKAAPRSDSPSGLSVTTIGSDESGKGDYFGPLIVAAVRLTPEEAAELAGGEVTDSKKLADATALRLGAALRGRYAHAIARLDPPEYNAERARVGNLNPMLASLHGDAIRELAEPGIHVLVDKFANEKLVRDAIADLDVNLEQRVRAEENIAVAAASVIAREQFLLALAELSDQFAVDLCKGAGSPVDRAGRRFLAVHGSERLGEVAKLHFRNTEKIGA